VFAPFGSSGVRGLVASRSESYYNLYSLKTDALSGMAKEMLAQAQPARPASEQDLCDFDRQGAGHLHHGRRPDQAFPMQERKFRVLLRHVLPSFSHGVRYTEKRVNEIPVEVQRRYRPPAPLAGGLRLHGERGRRRQVLAGDKE